MPDRIIRLNPNEYINEAGILSRIDDLLERYRINQPAVLVDQITVSIVKPYLPSWFLENHKLVYFEGECTYEEAKRLTELVDSNDGLIAIGGGQLLDTGKLVANKLNIKLVNIPTLPSNCAALTTKSIVYSSHDHEQIDNYRIAIPITAVLVEPCILAKAPNEYLLSGIGDTLAKYYEIRRRLAENQLDLVTEQISRYFIEITREEMLKVKDFSRLSGKDLTNFVDTVFLVAASVDGFADLDGRSVAAHTFYKAYEKVLENPIKTHGEIVALGSLFQVTLEENQSLIHEIKGYYQVVGLPLYLEDLKIEKRHLAGLAAYIAGKDNPRMQSIFPNISEDTVYKNLEKLRKGGD